MDFDYNHYKTFKCNVHSFVGSNIGKWHRIESFNWINLLFWERNAFVRGITLTSFGAAVSDNANVNKFFLLLCSCCPCPCLRASLALFHSSFRFVFLSVNTISHHNGKSFPFIFWRNANNLFIFEAFWFNPVADNGQHFEMSGKLIHLIGSTKATAVVMHGWKWKRDADTRHEIQSICKMPLKTMSIDRFKLQHYL